MTASRARPGRATRCPLVLTFVLTVMVLTACGGGSGAGEAGPAATAPAQAGRNQEPSGGDQGQGGESSGDHPGGLVQTVLAPGSTCPVAIRAGSTQQPLVRLERLDGVAVCFKGFDQNGPRVHVDLTSQSGGTQESADLDADTDSTGDTAWFWNVTVRTLDMPLGTSAIHATQDSGSGLLEARGQLAVVRATEPRVYAPSAGPAAPGASLRVQLAGLPSREPGDGLPLRAGDHSVPFPQSAFPGAHRRAG
jgi:hypothetical protein